MAICNPDFETAFRDKPKEYTTLLVYADWVDENGVTTEDKEFSKLLRDPAYHSTANLWAVGGSQKPLSKFLATAYTLSNFIRPMFMNYFPAPTWNPGAYAGGLYQLTAVYGIHDCTFYDYANILPTTPRAEPKKSKSVVDLDKRTMTKNLRSVPCKNSNKPFSGSFSSGREARGSIRSRDRR